MRFRPLISIIFRERPFFSAGCVDARASKLDRILPSFNKAVLMVTDDPEIPDEGGRIMLARVTG